MKYKYTEEIKREVEIDFPFYTYLDYDFCDSIECFLYDGDSVTSIYEGERYKGKFRRWNRNYDFRIKSISDFTLSESEEKFLSPEGQAEARQKFQEVMVRMRAKFEVIAQG